MSEDEEAGDRQQRAALLDLLLGVLGWDPHTRWTPRQALQHPFITGMPFTGPFKPAADVGLGSRLVSIGQQPRTQQQQQQQLVAAAGHPVVAACCGHRQLLQQQQPPCQAVLLCHMCHQVVSHKGQHT